MFGNRYKYLRVTFVALLLFFPTPLVFPQSTSEQEEEFTGEVVGVIDGDTISVMRLGEAVKIRLAEIDCPENKQAFGQKAKTFTSDLAFGEIVAVKMKTVDHHGRIVAEIILPDGRSLNRELVSAGFAWWYRHYSDDESLEAIENEARVAKRGLWSDLHAVPPWEFRSFTAPPSAQETNPKGTDGEMDQESADQDEQIVFFNTKTHKFHEPDCIHAQRCTKNCIPLKRKEAIKRGGTPCKVCGG